ncbi:MAG: hypothetical protein RI958_1966 [Actinomycetota bacterium]
MFGLALFGVGVAMLIDADLGAAPWDVFHQGVAERIGWAVGSVIVVTGLVLLVLWVPLRQRPGVGTLLNALEIGTVVNLTLPIIPDLDGLVARVGLMLGGIVIIALGSGFYIGAGIGPGPRDGLMLGLRDRGLSVRSARTLIEVSVLVLGILLGGTAGVGTVAFAVTIGPLVHIFLPRLTLEPRQA